MVRTYLQLLRPANVVTAFTDVLAGASLAGWVLFTGTGAAVSPIALVALLVATMGLYGGGIVYNDVCDADLDAIERPERPIPSKRISLADAFRFAVILFVVGIVASRIVGLTSMYLAIGIAVCAMIYDSWGKHQSWFGPLNMGLCRGGNLMLGMSILPNWLEVSWLMVFPVLYIAAITLISRGEVHGGKSKTMLLAGLTYLVIQGTQLVLSFEKGQLLTTAVFVGFHAYLIFPPLYKAYQEPIGKNIGLAVKAGVLGLIMMNASWISLSGDWILASCVTFLLPLSMRLARMFAVT